MKKLFIICFCIISSIYANAQVSDIEKTLLQNNLDFRYKIDTLKIKIDTLENKISRLESGNSSLDVKKINLHLEAHHKEFRKGLTIGSVGLSASVLGMLLIAFDQPQSHIGHNNVITYTHTTRGGGYFFCGAGALLSLIGGIVMIDSDKWFSVYFYQPPMNN
jgi:hypothetical protein